MPKNRKTKKQKIRASMKHSPVPTTASETATHTIPSTQQAVKLPEKFSTQPAFLHSTSGSLQAHTYLKGELIKTSALSAAIIATELIIFFFARNHLIVLPFVSY